MSGVTGQTGAPFTFLPVKVWLWWRGRGRKFLDVWKAVEPSPYERVREYEELRMLGLVWGWARKMLCKMNRVGVGVSVGVSLSSISRKRNLKRESWREMRERR